MPGEVGDFAHIQTCLFRKVRERPTGQMETATCTARWPLKPERPVKWHVAVNQNYCGPSSPILEHRLVDTSE
jgi:hypothetical protein